MRCRKEFRRTPTCRLQTCLPGSNAMELLRLTPPATAQARDGVHEMIAERAKNRERFARITSCRSRGDWAHHGQTSTLPVAESIDRRAGALGADDHRAGFGAPVLALRHVGLRSRQQRLRQRCECYNKGLP